MHGLILQFLNSVTPVSDLEERGGVLLLNSGQVFLESHSNFARKLHCNKMHRYKCQVGNCLQMSSPISTTVSTGEDDLIHLVR